VRELTTNEFDEVVLGSEKPVIVDFWAPWCRPCKAIRPILEELESETEGRVGFAGVDIDNYPEIAARYDVLSIPTVILFSGGEPQETLVGARPRSHFVKTFGPWLGVSESGPSQ
jgi:thioredoxin 1